MPLWRYRGVNLALSWRYCRVIVALFFGIDRFRKERSERRKIAYSVAFGAKRPGQSRARANELSRDDSLQRPPAPHDGARSRTDRKSSKFSKSSPVARLSRAGDSQARLALLTRAPVVPVSDLPVTTVGHHSVGNRGPHEKREPHGNNFPQHVLKSAPKLRSLRKQ